MSTRRRDIAIMRALGANRYTIFMLMMGEAVVISLLGGILGIILGHGVVAIASPAIEAAVGFIIPAWTFHPAEILLLLGVSVIGFLAGIGPAISAYKTDVASNISSS